MHMSLRKRPLALKLGLVAVAGAVGCLAFAGPSFASVPTGGGINCQQDGKISGRGSTLQLNLNTIVEGTGFRQDVCGPVTDLTGPSGPSGGTGPSGPTGSTGPTGLYTNAGSNMLAYNYQTAGFNSFTGSGSGLSGAECRTDAFNGTDVPYTSAQYTTLQAAGETSSSPCSAYNATYTNSGNTYADFVPPYAPHGTVYSGGTFPFGSTGITGVTGIDDTTTQSNVMSFPVAGAAVAVVANLTTGRVTGNTSTTSVTGITGCQQSGLQFTGAQLSAIYGGDVTNWNQLGPTGTFGVTGENTGLAGCNEPLTRVVRLDNSGTTNILKNYLIHADNSRSDAKTCLGSAPGAPTTQALQTWQTYQFWPAGSSTSNAAWPGYPTLSGSNQSGTKNATDGTCSNLITAASSGGQSLYTALQFTPGGVGYLDLSDFANASENTAPKINVQDPQVQNGALTGYASPASGTAANCSLSAATLPGSGGSDAVGFNANDTWANDNSTVNVGSADHNNVTDMGKLYPICGLTWDLVYAGLNGAYGNGPISQLNNDQRQTLYSYMTYLLSSTAQNRLGPGGYAPLPTSWLPLLQSGFQSNF